MILLTPAQKKIVADNHRFRVVSCGRRFGKTTAAVEEIKAFAVSQNERRISYIAPTNQQARDIAWEMLKKSLEPVIVYVNESRLEIEVRTQEGGTSKIVLRGWENIETLRGQKFHFLVIDEVAMMRNFWIGWQEVLRPTLTDTKGSALFISTPKGYNHFYDLYTTDDEDYTSFHFTTYDNPYVDKEEIDKAKLEIPEDKFYQEYMADFRKMEGLVYKEFNRELHVVDELPLDYVKFIGAIDFGYTNPYAFLLIGLDRDSHYWITKELYETGKTNPEIIQAIQTVKRDQHFTELYPDPAEPDRIAELRKAGFNCMGVSKDVTKGIDTVRTLFKENRIHIHKSCLNLIEELEGYRYPDPKPNKNESETPVKQNDHAVDALRYALFNQPQPRVVRKAYTPTFNVNKRLRRV